MERKIFKAVINYFLLFLTVLSFVMFFVRLSSDVIMAKVFLYFSAVFLILTFRANKTFKDGIWSRKKFVFLVSPGALSLILGFAWASYQKGNISEMFTFLMFSAICVIPPILIVWSERIKNKNKSKKC